MPAIYRRKPDPFTCAAMHPSTRRPAVIDPTDRVPLLRSATTRRSVLGALMALTGSATLPAASIAVTEPIPAVPPGADAPIVLAPVVVTAKGSNPADFADAPSVRQILDECEMDLHELPHVIGYIVETLIRHLGAGEVAWPFARDINLADREMVALLRRVQAGEALTPRQQMLAIGDVSAYSEIAAVEAMWAGAAVGFALGVTQPATIAGQSDWTARALAVAELTVPDPVPARVLAEDLVLEPKAQAA